MRGVERSLGEVVDVVERRSILKRDNFGLDANITAHEMTKDAIIPLKRNHEY
jgi:hypothetical protein